MEEKRLMSKDDRFVRSFHCQNDCSFGLTFDASRQGDLINGYR